MKLKRIDVLKKIWKYIVNSKKEVVLLILMSGIAAPLSLASPYLFSVLIDRVMNAQEFSIFKYIVLGLFGIFILRFVIDFINLDSSNKILNRFIYLVRHDIWKKYLHLEFSEYKRREVGDLKMRVFDDVDSLGNFVKDQFAEYIFNILMALFNLAVVLFISWKLTLLCIVVVPIVFYLNKILGNGTKKINEKIRNVNQEYNTFEHNSLQFWKEIKAHGVEDEFVSRFYGFRKILAKLGMKWIKFWYLNEVFNDFKANYLSKVMIYIIGAFFVINGSLSVGILIMFSECFSAFFANADEINKKNMGLKVNSPYYLRVFETLNFVSENENNKQKPILQGDIQVSDLSFRYDVQSPLVLNNISLKIKHGDYIVIIGKSGCGKTTLVKMLLNLYNSARGSIRINNIFINEISKKAYYNQIGIVMQDTYVFNMSIKENLRLANRSATYYDLVKACEKANILEFVNGLPEGFDTIIGERGIKLSGGQKQRIAIARALLKNPKLIIFDEATSSVDKMSEDIIFESINKISKDITVIVVSHKPSVILRANRVIVIDEGMITAMGTHDELIKSNDYYKRVAGT